MDGLYVIDGKGEPVFRCVPPPTDKEIARVAERIHRRVARLMEKRGLGPQADPDEADGQAADVLVCDRCGGRMKVLCAVHPPAAILKILTCLGLPSRPPPIAQAAPAFDDPYIS